MPSAKLTPGADVFDVRFRANELQAGLEDRAAMNTAPRSQVASVSGHPRFKPASRIPVQRSRLALVSGHPRFKPASRTPVQ